MVEEVQEFENKPIKEAELIKDEYSNGVYKPATDSFESDKEEYLANKENTAQNNSVPPHRGTDVQGHTRLCTESRRVKLVPEHAKNEEVKYKEASDEDTIDLNKG